MKRMFLFAALTLGFGSPLFAQEMPAEPAEQLNMMDELDPYDPNIESILDLYDAEYEAETGESPILSSFDFFPFAQSTCYRMSCTVYAKVVKAEQKMYLYVNGTLQGTWDTSTGTKGHRTPNFDTHPNGRIYNRYTSRRYPGGDYNGLGNMPYAVFISGGFAIHGTGKSNWSKLGQPASHGCIRIHPDNAIVFNRLVREHGIRNTWITVM